MCGGWVTSIILTLANWDAHALQQVEMKLLKDVPAWIR